MDGGRIARCKQGNCRGASLTHAPKRRHSVQPHDATQRGGKLTIVYFVLLCWYIQLWLFIFRSGMQRNVDAVLVQLDFADEQIKKKTPVKMAVSEGLVALYCCFFFLLEMSVRNLAFLLGYALSYLFSLWSRRAHWRGLASFCDSWAHVSCAIWEQETRLIYSHLKLIIPSH